MTDAPEDHVAWLRWSAQNARHLVDAFGPHWERHANRHDDIADELERLRSILAWHQPIGSGVDAGNCGECDEPWPCTTRQAADNTPTP